MHKLLTGERILGLDLLRGRKVGGTVEDAGQAPDGARLREEPQSPPKPGPEPAAPERSEVAPAGEAGETEGLPLFGSEPGDAEETS